ncbi:unnamed protein product [Allacma fusca]|uniref:Uncharacterized protein n=1 Tax=Allacma fusca TaxID=39272 RepID=A0A8J2JIU9_9HEXA|nr:unnamed protein product [Allacma fusca]
MRWLALLFAKYFTTDIVEIASTRDIRSASFGPTTADMNTMICVTLDGSVLTEKFKKLFHLRIIEAKDSNGKSEYDRYKWTWTFFFGYAFWKRSNFKLEEHFREYDLKNGLSLPNPCWEKDLEHVLGSLCISKWDARRSPCEILIIQNYLTDYESGCNDSFSTAQYPRRNEVCIRITQAYSQHEILSSNSSEWIVSVTVVVMYFQLDANHTMEDKITLSSRPVTDCGRKTYRQFRVGCPNWKTLDLLPLVFHAYKT